MRCECPSGSAWYLSLVVIAIQCAMARRRCLSLHVHISMPAPTSVKNRRIPTERKTDGLLGGAKDESVSVTVGLIVALPKLLTPFFLRLFMGVMCPKDTEEQRRGTSWCERGRSEMFHESSHETRRRNIVYKSVSEMRRQEASTGCVVRYFNPCFFGSVAPSVPGFSGACILSHVLATCCCAT